MLALCTARADLGFFGDIHGGGHHGGGHHGVGHHGQGAFSDVFPPHHGLGHGPSHPHDAPGWFLKLQSHKV